MWRGLFIILLAGAGCGGDTPAAPAAPTVTPRQVTLALPTGALRVDRGPVTVAQYADFVAATGYVTDAEAFGDAGVFDEGRKAWRLAAGAFWRQPFGKTAGGAPPDHPVTQVSHRDARAYCAHYGCRLPTAAEWEAAAEYGLDSAATGLYPWGEGIRDGATGDYRANVWQGIFPHVRRVEDGYAYTSPVGAYGEHPSGLVDMAGNVWEWTADSVAGVGVPGDRTHYLSKGGSFLCEPGWCHGYLTTGSSHNSEETGLFHTGFRCVCDVQ